MKINTTAKKKFFDQNEKFWFDCFLVCSFDIYLFHLLKEEEEEVKKHRDSSLYFSVVHIENQLQIGSIPFSSQFNANWTLIVVDQ